MARLRTGTGNSILCHLLRRLLYHKWPGCMHQLPGADGSSHPTLLRPSAPLRIANKNGRNLALVQAAKQVFKDKRPSPSLKY